MRNLKSIIELKNLNSKKLFMETHRKKAKQESHYGLRTRLMTIIEEQSSKEKIISTKTNAHSKNEQEKKRYNGYREIAQLLKIGGIINEQEEQEQKHDEKEDVNTHKKLRTGQKIHRKEGNQQHEEEQQNEKKKLSKKKTLAIEEDSEEDQNDDLAIEEESDELDEEEKKVSHKRRRRISKQKAQIPEQMQSLREESPQYTGAKTDSSEEMQGEEEELEQHEEKLMAKPKETTDMDIEQSHEQEMSASEESEESVKNRGFLARKSKGNFMKKIPKTQQSKLYGVKEVQKFTWNPQKQQVDAHVIWEDNDELEIIPAGNLNETTFLGNIDQINKKHDPKKVYKAWALYNKKPWDQVFEDKLKEARFSKAGTIEKLKDVEPDPSSSIFNVKNAKGMWVPEKNPEEKYIHFVEDKNSNWWPLNQIDRMRLTLDERNIINDLPITKERTRSIRRLWIEKKMRKPGRFVATKRRLLAEINICFLIALKSFGCKFTRTQKDQYKNMEPSEPRELAEIVNEWLKDQRIKLEVVPNSVRFPSTLRKVKFPEGNLIFCWHDVSTDQTHAIPLSNGTICTKEGQEIYNKGLKALINRVDFFKVIEVAEEEEKKSE